MRGVLHIPLEHKRVGRAIVAGKDNVAAGIGRIVKHITGRRDRHDRNARPDAVETGREELSEWLPILIDPVHTQHNTRLRGTVARRDLDLGTVCIIVLGRVLLVHRIGKIELIAHSVGTIALAQIPAQELGIVRDCGNLNRLAGIAIAVLSGNAQMRKILRRIGRLRIVDMHRIVLELKSRLEGQVYIRRKRIDRLFGDIPFGLGIIPALKGKVIVEHSQSTGIERDLGARIDRHRTGNIGQLNAVHQLASAPIVRLDIRDRKR